MVRSFMMAAVSLILVSSLSLAADDKPLKGKKETGPHVQGVVESVDAAKSTIVVRVSLPQVKQTEQKSFEVAKDVKVILMDTLTKQAPALEGKLTDLSAGVQVTLVQSADKKAVVEIHARGPSISGRVIKFDPASNTLTITTKDKSGASERSFSFAKDAKVLLNDGLSKGTADQEGKLTDLTESTSVLVQLSVDQKSALSLRVQGQSYRGVLKSHDAANNTITITVKSDAGLVDMTYKVSKDARLVDLTEGSPVNLRMSVFDKETVILAQGAKQ